MPISGNINTGPVLAFVDCGVDSNLGTSGGSGQVRPQARREVVINDKRVKTVDVHAHCIVPEAAQLLNHSLEAPGLLWSNISDRLAQMDKTGVDVQALRWLALAVSGRCHRSAARGGS